MKKLLAALAVIAGCSYYFLGSSTPAPTPSAPLDSSSSMDSDTDTASPLLAVAAKMSGDWFSVRLEDNHVEYKTTGEFTGDFRVFGVTPNDKDNSPASHVSAFVTLAQLETVRSIVAKEGCERTAAQSAKTVAMVVTDDAVASQLEELSSTGGELTLSGRILEMETHTFAGRKLEPSSSTIDLQKVYLLSSVERAAPASPAVPSSLSAPPADPGYNWNFSPTVQVSRETKAVSRPSCNKRRVVRVIRRCPR